MSARGRVLIVSFYFPPMNGPVVRQSLWLRRYLPEFGADPIVLTSSAYSGEILDTKSPPLTERVMRVPRTALGQKLSYQAHKAEMLLQNRLGIWEHGFVWSFLASRKAMKLHRRNPFDAMISISPSMASHWTAYRIKKRFPAIRWLAKFQDPFIDNPFRRSHRSLDKYERALERNVFHAADRISANTNTVCEIWRSRYPEIADNFVVTWGGYDPDEVIEPLPQPKHEGLLLRHVGTIYAGRRPDKLIESLDRLTQSGEIRPGSMTLELIGLSDLSGFIQPNAIDRLIAGGWLRVGSEYIPRAEALRAAEESDALLLLDIAPGNTKLQVPAKLFDYIRIGRPILAFTAAGSPVEYILSRSGIDHVIIHNEAEPSDVDAGMLHFMELKPSEKRASEWFLKNFNARSLVGSLARLVLQ